MSSSDSSFLCCESDKGELKSSSFSLSLLSPAKINLFFRILFKRDDGYHDIASLYQAIGLFDKITFTESSTTHFTCSDTLLAMDETNLCVKAWRLFKSLSGVKEIPFSLHLQKNVPMQAGLGGGSANAATVLYGLNLLMGNPFSQQDLAAISSQLGSDVPFFFSSGTAYCTSRGEKLQSVGFKPDIGQITIVKPSYGLSTPLVFKTCNVADFTKRDPIATLRSIEEGQPLFYNDLEIPSFFLLPSLKELKGLLESAGFTAVVMCGSGTAFFCLGDGDLSGHAGLSVYKTYPVFKAESGWYEKIAIC